MIGYDVVTAGDGEEALLTFRSYDPDLVVLGATRFREIAELGGLGE